MSNLASKQLDACPDADAQAIVEALSQYAITGRGDVKRLHGRPGYRMRVRDYRVLFHEDAVTVLAVGIGRRTTTFYRR